MTVRQKGGGFMPIQKNIRKNYLKKLIRQIVCLGILLLFWVFSPFQDFFFPTEIPVNALDNRLNDSTRYAVFEEVTVHSTGYCFEKGGKARGYYYYGFIGDDCLFFLLKNSTCNNGQETLTLKELRGSVFSNSSALNLLITNLAADLSWDSTQLNNLTKPFLINEMNYHFPFWLIFYGVLFFISLLTLLAACFSLFYFLRPAVSPVCGSVFHPGRCVRRLLLAEREISENCLVQGKNFYITKHFIIELGGSYTHILRIKNLAWVYSHNGSLSFLGRKRRVRHIITYYSKRKHAVHSVYNRKKAVDTILGFLRDYYPEILNGYTPENQELFKNLSKLERASERPAADSPAEH